MRTSGSDDGFPGACPTFNDIYVRYGYGLPTAVSADPSRGAVRIDTDRSPEEPAMMVLLREVPAFIVRPRVTLDPQHAAALTKRFSELAYSPENGFHRDQQQAPTGAPRLTLVP